MKFNFNLFKRDANNNSNPNQYVPYADSLLFGLFEKHSAMTLSAFFGATNLISQSISQLPIVIKLVGDDKTAIVQNHPVADLFYRSSRLSKHQLLSQIVRDIILKGNAFVYIKRNEAGKPIKLNYLQPSSVIVQYDQLTDKITYLVSGVQKEIKHTVQAEDMLHFYMWSNNTYSGSSLLGYACRSVESANHVESRVSSYYSSGCAVSGILKFKGRVTDEQKKAIRLNWQQIHGSSADGSGLAVLEGDSEYIPVQGDANASQLFNARNFSVLDLARFFNISPVLLGDNTSKATYADLESAQTDFVLHCLSGWVSMIQEEIDRKLLKNQPNIYSVLDTDYLMRSKKIDMSNYLKNLVSGGIMTVNEARELIDLNPMEGGDELIMPYTDVKMNTLGNSVEEKLEEKAE